MVSDMGGTGNKIRPGRLSGVEADLAEPKEKPFESVLHSMKATIRIKVIFITPKRIHREYP